MAQRIAVIAGVGQVTLVKRRGARNIRISISPDGQARVSMPNWVPYATAISFAQKRSQWIKQHQAARQPIILKDGDRIGKAHTLHFRPSASNSVTTRVDANNVWVSSSLPYDSDRVQSRANAASERALKQESEKLLKIRLAQLAAKHKFIYKEARVRKLTSRWGSCTSSGIISLSYFLIQLPWELIDYVLLHELIHTRHLNHSKDFWSEFENLLPNAKQSRKKILGYKPRVEPQA